MSVFESLTCPHLCLNSPLVFMKILVCDPISPKGIELLKQRPEFNVVVLPKPLPEAELIPLVSDVVALVVRSETKVKAKGHRSRQTTQGRGSRRVGVDNVDIEAATKTAWWS